MEEDSKDSRPTGEKPIRKLGDRIYRVPSSIPRKVILEVLPKTKSSALSPLMLVYGFIGLIALGTILLLLPISTNTGQSPPAVDAFFTATSAVCVTGLVVVDTGTYWSSFGQGVILGLIQIGGFGFMTSTILLLLALRRKIGLRERLLISESMGLTRLGTLVGLVKRIAIFTLLTESIGAALFYIRFSAENPIGTAVWKSVFQAVSAFNNAGFDIFGNFRSLMDYQGDALVILVTAALIILGGISFLVVADVFSVRRLSKLSLDSKVVLATTISLLVVGTVIILFSEFSNSATLGNLPLSQKLLDAFFQSVTPRTAGFSVIDIARLADYTLFLTIGLMFIGGASGSTAGGIKVNTFGMLIATMWSSIRGREYAGAFEREFKTQQIYRALAVFILAVGFMAIVVFILTITEDVSFLSLLFETVSAFGTVGLSTGITPGLSMVGRLILAVTMFVGRLGPLVLVLSLIHGQRPSTFRYPQETIRIG